MTKITTGVSPAIDKRYPAKEFAPALSLNDNFAISPAIDKRYPDTRRPAPAINLTSFSVQPTDYGRQNRFNRSYEPYRPLDLTSIDKIDPSFDKAFASTRAPAPAIRLERLFGVTPAIDQRYPAPKAA